jgi:hypothetical protein
MLDATPLLRLYAFRRQRQLAALAPAAAQIIELLTLVSRARDTRFGQDQNFAGIRTVADFQRNVPLRRYDAFWDQYWQPDFPRLTDCTWPGTVPFFAVSSGTTRGVTKFLPLTHEMNRSNVRAATDLLVHHLANRPTTRILAGRSFMLGGSTKLVERAPGIFSGDLSGIAAKVMPWWARLRYFPPRALEAIEDWDVKIDRFARASLDQDIRSISGTPSWLLLYLEKLFEVTNTKSNKINDIYPNLEMLVHGGVNFEPYRGRFDDLLAGSHAETREVYPASEGFFAIADRGPGDGLRLILDNGLFYEFVPVEEIEAERPTRHWIADAEMGVNYALVVSTIAGLWSYVVGDTVRFVSLDPPRVLVTGRISYMLSAFGEHLIGEEIEAAVADAARQIDAQVTDYAVGSRFPDAGRARGGHLYVVEFAAPVEDPARLDRFAAALDAHLSETNDDYAAHRAAGFGLDPPRIHPVPHGTFAAWMKTRGQLGGQHKVPRVINDQTLFADLKTFIAAD